VFGRLMRAVAVIAVVLAALAACGPSTPKAVGDWWTAHQDAVETLTFHANMLITSQFFNACDLLPGDLRAVSGLPSAPDSRLQSALLSLYTDAGDFARDCARPSGISDVEIAAYQSHGRAVNHALSNVGIYQQLTID
jgi:hypothetical protein